MLIQNCIDQGKYVTMCSIDYKKSFDKVHHHKLIQILKRLDTNQRDFHCIDSLYWNQKVEVNIDNKIREA